MNLSYAIVLLVSSLAPIILTFITWRRRTVPGGSGLTVMCAGMTIWMTAYAFTWLFPSLQTRLIFFNLMYVGVEAVPITFLLFAFNYTNRTHWLKNKTVVLLLVIPVITMVLLWVEPLRGFFYGNALPGNLYHDGGVWFRLNGAYCYGLTLFSLVLLVQAWFSTVRLLRWQLSTIILGMLVPILLNVVMLLGFRPFPELDLTPFGFLFTSGFVAIALNRFRLLDIVPVARSLLIDQMADGFLVVDPQDRIVDANKMAHKMLGESMKEIVGLPAEKIFGRLPHLYNRYRETTTMHEEIFVESDPPRYLDLHITPLYDNRQQLSGRLVVAHDISDRKIIEHAEHEQRVLAEALRDTSAALNRSRSFEEVLDRILDNIDRVVPYDMAAILLADDEHSAHLARERGYRENGLEEYLLKVGFNYDSLPNMRRMIETGTSVVISDTSQENEWKIFEGLEQIHSYIGSPIRIRDLIVGFLDLTSFKPGFFTQVHADRLQAFSDQAAIAIENARLLENAQKRGDELSALLDIGQAATSRLELDKILKSLLEECKRILPIEAFYLATFDNASGIVSYPLFYDQGETLVLSSTHLDDESGLGGHVIRTRKVLYIPDALDPAAVKKYNIVQFGGAPTRSYVGVPLMVGDRVVGVISMQSSLPYAYNQTQIQLLETIATQVSGAIENARLFEEVRSRAEEMTALFDIGLAITSGLEMSQILRALLEKCRQVLPVEAFYTAILDPESGLIRHPLAFDMGEYPEIPPRDIKDNPGLSGYIINTRKTLYIPDLLSPDAVTNYQIFRTSGKPTRAFVGVPMIFGDRVVGVISMQSYQPNAYDEGQIRLLETIASQAAVAIENSRLYEKAQQEIAERENAEQRYRALFEQSHDAVFIIGFDGKHWEANQRATELLGYSDDEIRSLFVWDISSQPEETASILERLLRGEHIPLYERTFKRVNGEDIIVEINAELVRDADGTPLHIQSVVREITQRKKFEHEIQEANLRLQQQIAQTKKLEVQLREEVIRDPLTGLYNRRYLEETLEREFSLAKRQSTPICLVMIDIDGFKGFNDTYGHDAGDFLLKQLSELLRTDVRQSDISCRYGGEEFLVVMPGVPIEKGHERAEHLRKTFASKKFVHMGGKLSATISIGVAVYPQNGHTWEEVLHAADRAMYAAKAAGKNRVRSSRD